MPDSLPWLPDVRRLLLEACGPQPGAVRIVIAYADSGHGLELMLPPQEDGWPAEIAAVPNGAALREIHTQILGSLTTTPRPAKAVARAAGYQFGSHVRAALAELVRWGLALHGPDGYALSVTGQGHPPVED
jgi:hypothetical protein